MTVRTVEDKITIGSQKHRTRYYQVVQNAINTYPLLLEYQNYSKYIINCLFYKVNAALGYYSIADVAKRKNSWHY